MGLINLNNKKNYTSSAHVALVFTVAAFLLIYGKNLYCQIPGIILITIGIVLCIHSYYNAKKIEDWNKWEQHVKEMYNNVITQKDNFIFQLQSLLKNERKHMYKLQTENSTKDFKNEKNPKYDENKA